ncbi:MAG TPA: hypothetical protein VNE16_16545 [Vicinamibacterales bacterium]|nr:hypothetical protein [Vicinamibacterales bacterium]
MSDQPGHTCPFDGRPLRKKSVVARPGIDGSWPAEHVTFRTSWTCPSPGCTYCEPDNAQTLAVWGWLRVYYQRLAERAEYRRLTYDARWALLVHAVEHLGTDPTSALEPLKRDAATRAEILSWLEKLRRAEE